MVILTDGATKPLLNASIEALQRAVDGEIETAPLILAPKNGGFYALVLIKNARPEPRTPLNYVATRLLGFPIAGNVAVVQPTINGNWEKLEKTFYKLLQTRVEELNTTQERYKMKVYTRKEVMEMLGISATYFTKMIEAGTLSASVVGSRYLITEENLKEFFEKTKASGIQKPRNPKLRKETND